MKFSKVLKINFLIFCSIYRCLGQDCLSEQELGNIVKTDIIAEYSKFDSLELTFFVKFMVDSTGSLNSIWISGNEVLNVDYDKYIHNTNGKPLKMLYTFYKNENLIRNRIVFLLKNVNRRFCLNENNKGYFIMPLIVNFKSENPHSNYQNLKKALSELNSNSFEEYYFLTPVIIKRVCKGCL